MRRLLATTLMVGILGLVAVMPVAALTMTDVTIVVTTTFDDQPDAFTAEGLPGCESGLVYDGPANFAGTRHHGVYAGFKVFECGDDTGFILRLNARFNEDGSVGTWAVVASWGSLAGLSGAGSLTGDPFGGGGGITDTYVGSIRF